MAGYVLLQKKFIFGKKKQKGLSSGGGGGGGGGGGLGYYSPLALALERIRALLRHVSTQTQTNAVQGLQGAAEGLTEAVAGRLSEDIQTAARRFRFLADDEDEAKG